MGLEIVIDLSDLDKLSALADRPLPSEAEQNPVALSIVDFQQRLRDLERPTVSGTSNVHDAIWQGFPAAYVSHVRKDGNLVPFWPVPRAKNITVEAHTRKRKGKAYKVRQHIRKGRSGKTKGVRKSEATGSGVGSSYKSDDRQLGARPGGLWDDWISQDPVMSDNNRAATITSPFKYAARQHSKRPLHTQEDEKYIEERLVLRADDYYASLIRKEGL